MADTFGPYDVMELVATGTTGRVYRVHHRELDRVAAVKELAPQLREVPGLLERLRAEAELLSTMSHPNIVDVYDYVEEPGRAWLAEQWVDGASLQAIVDTNGRLTPEQSLGVVRGALTGLAHAHAHDVVHRDVSTANVLADQQGTSMLVDFGLAGPAGAGPALGTPAFLSPEAARGEAVGKPGDVYSAAAVLHTLLTGAPVFPAADALAMVRAHAEQPAPRLEDHGADLADLLERSLSKDPADRPADAAAFLAELEQAAQRRYGAAWLSRASIAGLVGAAMAAGATATAVAGAGAGAGAAASTAAQTVLLDAARIQSSLPAAATKATRPARRLSKLGLTAGAAGLAVAVVAVGAYAVHNRRHDTQAAAALGSTGKTNGQNAAKTATPTPTPTVDPVVASVPDGLWVLTTKVIKTDNPAYLKLGETERSTVRLTPACVTASACSGSITSSEGTYSYAWDGRSIRWSLAQREVFEGLCVDDAGKKVPRTHAKEVRVSTDAVLVPRGTSFVGQYTVQSTISELTGKCVNKYGRTGSPSPRATIQYLLSPKQG